MTKQMLRSTMIFLLASVVVATPVVAQTTTTHTEWLFVQNAQSVKLADGVLTLEGISPTTLYFSDRPERISAHGLTSEFVTFWGKGGGSDNFKKDPPNAVLSIVSEDAAQDIVLTLADPQLDGDTLRYNVTIIEGRDSVEGGPSSLFVDVIGMPLTPVSYAGARRRAVRRAVW